MKNLITKYLRGMKEKLFDAVFEHALKKAIKRIIQLLISYIAARELSKYGIDLSLDGEKLTLVLFGLLEVLRSNLKQRLGIKIL